jgi:hypothetical protein
MTTNSPAYRSPQVPINHQECNGLMLAIPTESEEVKQHSNCICSTCRKILDFLRNPVHQMPLGKARILLDGDCFHVDFFESLEYLYRPLPDTDYLNTLMYISGDSDHVRFKAD